MVLTSLSRLSKLTSVAGEFQITGNHAPANLNGLSALTSIGDRLVVGYNSSLSDVDGLSSLTSVGSDLSVIDNFHLVRCCGLYPLLSSGGVGGYVKIYGNGAGCEEIDILEGGPCPPVPVHTKSWGGLKFQYAKTGDKQPE